MTWPLLSIGLTRFRSILEQDHPDLAWRPLPLLLESPDRSDLETLLEKRGVNVFDQLDRQLHELARVRWPGTAERPTREAFARDAVAGPDGYRGVWMYFHWARRLVRVLERDDYFEVITSRNHDKITRAEQARLRSRVVGVVGLSVGGEIAVTLAQEHLCGRIKVADFDDLDLSNLNRLGAGVDDLGVNKAHLIARRISSIDPWLDVEVFPEGLTEENMLAFLDGLDLVVDECDGLGMKFRIREMAQALGLNLLYAADERGMVSVEPYGQAEMELFHGLVTKPHPPREAYPSDEAFFRALTDWLGGWDRISERSRESLLRVGRDLAGYPQLAGEPRYAAGQVAHAARRMLLGEKLQPCLIFQDLEELFPTSEAPERDVESAVTLHRLRPGDRSTRSAPASPGAAQGAGAVPGR